MQGAGVCFGSGNLKAPKGPHSVRFLIFSPAIDGRALVGDGLGEFGAGEDYLRGTVHPEHQRTFECSTCGQTEKIAFAVDPMKSDAVGWLVGELRPPR
jgi:hypothetical protein